MGLLLCDGCQHGLLGLRVWFQRSQQLSPHFHPRRRGDKDVDLGVGPQLAGQFA